MKVLVLYRPNSEHGRLVEEFIRDYSRNGRTGKIEGLNVDTRDGSAMATLYDVVRYPTILAVRDDGSILRAWDDDMLPLQDEVAAYSYS